MRRALTSMVRCPIPGKAWFTSKFSIREFSCKDLFQELSQLGNVPLTVTQLEKDALFRSLRIDGKHLIEGTTGLQHSHLRIQHDQRLLYGFQNALRKIAGCLQKMRCSNVGKSHDDAVNVVVHRPVRHHAHQERPEVRGLDDDFFRNESLQYGLGIMGKILPVEDSRRYGSAAGLRLKE